MSEWRECHLGDIGAVTSGGTPSRERAEYWGGTVPWITPGELTGSSKKYVSETQDYITELGLAASGARLLPDGSLLVTSRASIGSCALAGRPMATNQGFKNVVPSAMVDPSFLFHLGSTLGREMVRRASGTTFLEISGREFERIMIKLPPLEEQRRIAEVLDTIDETVQATERVIEKHRSVVEGILQGACLGRPSAKDPVLPISEFCTLSAGRTAPRGISAYYGGGVPWVKSGEVAGSAILSTEETVSVRAVHELGLRMFRPGTPLIAMYGATAGEVGWLELDAATNQAVLAVEPEPEYADRRWLYWALRLNSDRMLGSIQGSGQPNLSKQLIGATKMSLPGIKEQLAEVERIDSAQKLLDAQYSVAAKLRHMRAALAADLLSGRVRTVAG